MPPRKSGVVIPNRLPWYLRLVVWALSFFASLLMATWRLRVLQPLPKPQDPGPAIFCLWHNRLSMAAIAWLRFVRYHWPADGVAGVISASKDGAILSEVVGHFGIKTVRGSSSRRGPQALLEACHWLEKNHHVAITPDGPRGPRYRLQPGVIQLAQVSGRPIILIGFHFQYKYSFNSWDGFQVPLPFSRCDLRFGEPVFVPRDATDEQREELRIQLEQTLMALTTD